MFPSAVPSPTVSTTRAQLEASGRFRVLERLGAGGTGVVYRVYDQERSEQVALKTLRLQTPTTIHGIKREFRALADVVHPNLVALYELLCIADCWCIAMELVEGSDFVSYVAKPESQLRTRPAATTSATPPAGVAPTGLAVEPAGPRTLETPADMARLAPALKQLASAVSALHQAGKLHLDLKPQNVLVSQHGRLVVLDFGLMRGIEEPSLPTRRAGTPAYMAPEQALGGALTAATDWYAVGAMLHEALTGRTPFVGSSELMLAEKLRRDALRPSSLAHGIPNALDALCQELLRRDPLPRAGAARVARALGVQTDSLLAGATSERGTRGPLRSPFVGRADTLVRLQTAFEQSGQQTARAAMVHGPSGIGKTALAQHWLANLRTTERQTLVFEGRCYEREAVPYRALDSIVDELVQYLRTLPDAQVDALLPAPRTALARMFPALLQVPAFSNADLRPAGELDEQLEREQAFAALKRLLGSLAHAHRVVFFIDDVQWGDRDSALLVRELLAPPHAPALFWLFTYRSEEAASSPFLRALALPSLDAAMPGVLSSEQLLPLTEEDARQLARQVLPRAGEREQLAFAVAGECEGNPFFAEQLVRALAGGTRPLRAAGQALTLDRVLLDNVRALSTPEQRLLERVCVVGRPIERRLALSLCEPGSSGHSVIESLRARRFLRTRGVREIDLVEPYHDRISHTVGKTVLPAERARICLKLAREVDARQRGDAQLLTMLYAEAGEPALAARHAERAAEQAEAALAFDHAAALLRRALSLGSETHTRSDRARLHEALASAYEHGGAAGEAAEAYLRAAEHAEPDSAVALRRKAAEQHLVCGHYAEGIALFRQTLPQFGISLARGGARALLSLAYQRAKLRLRGLSFRERAERDVAPALLSRIDTSYAVANSLGMLDSLVAAEIQTRGVLWSLAAGEPQRVMRALTYECAFRCGALRGQAQTQHIIDTAGRLSERLGRDDARGLFAFGRGFFAHHGSGALQPARVAYEQGEPLLVNTPGMNGEVVMLRCNLVTVLDWLGDLRALSARIPVHLEDAERRGDQFLKTGLVSAATHWLAHDAVDDLARHLADCRPLWPSDTFVMPYYWMLVAAAQRDLYVGDARGCLTRIAAALPSIKRALYWSIPTVRIEVGYPRARAALLAAAQGHDVRQNLQLARRDIAMLAHTRRAYAEALAASLYPCLRALEGAPEASVATAFNDALSECQRAGLLLQVEAIRHRLGSLFGGELGLTLTGQAVRSLRERGVREPMRLICALAPGKNAL